MEETSAGFLATAHVLNTDERVMMSIAVILRPVPRLLVFGGK